MAREGVRKLRKLMEDEFAPYLRGKSYQRTFQRMLEVLERSEFDDEKLNDRDAIYLFFHLVLLDGFDRLERIEKKIGSRR